MEVSEFEVLLGELETRVDRLRSLYEQYFMGIEKLIPSVPHKDVDRRIQILRREQPRNTGLRFRFQMVIQRYNTYQSYWMRVCRQIEEGTYKRDVIRAKKRLGDDAARPAGSPGASADRQEGLDAYELADDDLEEELEDFLEDDEPERPSVVTAPVSVPRPSFVPAAPVTRPSLTGDPPSSRPSFAPMSRPAALAGLARPAWKKVDGQETADAGRESTVAPEPRPVAQAPRPVAAAPQQPREAAPRKPEGDLSEERIRKIYSQYVDTKRQQNESTAKLTYDDLARTIRDSSAKLRERHAGKNVDFEVSVRDGKTVLKPVVK